MIYRKAFKNNIEINLISELETFKQKKIDKQAHQEKTQLTMIQSIGLLLQEEGILKVEEVGQGIIIRRHMHKVECQKRDNCKIKVKLKHQVQGL